MRERENFVELWRNNQGERYGHPILTTKDIVVTHKLISEEESRHLEIAGFKDQANLLLTEKWLLLARLKKLNGSEKAGLRDIRDFRKQQEELENINEDIGAIDNEIRIQVEKGRIKAYYAARALQNEADMKEFEILLSEFSEIYARIEAHGAKINDLISVGAQGTMYVQNGLKYLQALLKRGFVHDMYRMSF